MCKPLIQRNCSINVVSFVAGTQFCDHLKHPHSILTTFLVSSLSCQSFRWCAALEIEPTFYLDCSCGGCSFFYCSYCWRVNFNAARTWLGHKLCYLAMTVGKGAAKPWAAHQQQLDKVSCTFRNLQLFSFVRVHWWVAADTLLQLTALPSK